MKTYCYIEKKILKIGHPSLEYFCGRPVFTIYTQYTYITCVMMKITVVIVIAFV